MPASKRGYSWAERMSIREHYFRSKVFAAASESFISAYPNTDVAGKTIHRMVTEEGNKNGRMLILNKVANIFVSLVCSS
jgi:hypothetical protein